MDVSLLLTFLSCFVIGLFVTQLMQAKVAKGKPLEHAKTLIVLGSGGHTAEMLALLRRMNPQKYSPRQYVAAATDALGYTKAKQTEQFFSNLQQATEGEAQPKVFAIPRSREVGQSYLTSIWTTLVAIMAAFTIVSRSQPDVVLVNGPGTCIPICLAAILLRPFNLWRGQIVYLESIARVSSLSLSGKILYELRLANLFFVQWPELQKQFPRSLYAGRLF